ncbi:MAG TPA: hypothetical protein VNX29_04320 [Kaistia sp.]|nr:hypothetical protein [Kaistia sp.]
MNADRLSTRAPSWRVPTCRAPIAMPWYAAPISRRASWLTAIFVSLAVWGAIGFVFSIVIGAL